jgi:hypothetical protein
MKTLHGRNDHVMGSAVEPRLVFEGQTYALPEGSAGTAAFSFLVLARSFGRTVTLEVDDDGTVRAATVELDDECSLTFSLPDGTPTVRR